MLSEVVSQAKTIAGDGGHADDGGREADFGLEAIQAEACCRAPEDGVDVLRSAVHGVQIECGFCGLLTGKTYGQVPVITGEEVDSKVEVVLGEEAGLEVWAEELLCGLAGAEGVVEPALCEGHSAATTRLRRGMAGGRRRLSGRGRVGRQPIGPRLDT